MAVNETNVTVTVDGLYKSYADQKRVVGAVRGVSFTIREGEFYTLLGPSGCGKTTTMRCIAGLEHTEQGEISIHGKLVSSPEKNVFVPPNKRRHRDGVPELRDLAAHDGISKRRLPAQRRRHPQRFERDARTRRGSARAGRDGRLRRPFRNPALGRSAATPRARPCARPPARLAALGRTALEPRCAAARYDAYRVAFAAAPPRDHDALRYARSNRGAEHEQPHRGDAGRADRTRSDAARALPLTGQRVRGRVPWREQPHSVHGRRDRRGERLRGSIRVSAACA